MNRAGVPLQVQDKRRKTHRRDAGATPNDRLEAGPTPNDRLEAGPTRYVARHSTRYSAPRRGIILDSAPQRGIILVVVLVVVTVLTLVGASFSYWMNADLAGLQAANDRQQARLAAESGLARAILLLRTDRADMDRWYNNPESFRRILVWSPDKVGGSESLADQEKIEGQPAWRFSIISYEIEGASDNVRIRYGMTDETSKLNLNTATREQLLVLFDQLKLVDISSQELADALIDWRDEDDTPISEFGAESGYYMTLDPPYRAKNRPLETIEELLMVRGFDGRVLYGEDYNRNGYLDANEDDGPEGSFPPDNGDGLLDRGLLPYVTVYTWDYNQGNDKKFRLNLNFVQFSNPDPWSARIIEEFPQETIDFITEAQKRLAKRKPKGGFRSVGELVGLEVFEDGSTNYDDLWREYDADRKAANEPAGGKETPPGDEGDRQGRDGQPPGGQPPDENVNGGQWPQESDGLGEEADGRAQGRRRTAEDRREESRARREQDRESDPSAEEKDEQRRQQSIRDRQGESNEEDNRRDPFGGVRNETRNEDGNEQDKEASSPEDRRENRRRGRSQREAGGSSGGTGAPGETGGQDRKGTPVVSPVTEDQLAVLVDRLTVIAQPVVPGLINVNTASAQVLMTVPGLTAEEAQGIVATRDQMPGEDKLTTAWLVTSGALSAEKFALVSNQLTTRSLQYQLDVIGFADHVGAARRIQAVIEMRGQLSQLKYYRDITRLGMGYPVWDDQRSEGFSFDAR